MHLVLVNYAYVDSVGSRQDTASAEEEDKRRITVKFIEKRHPGRSDQSFKEKEGSFCSSTQRLGPRL